MAWIWSGAHEEEHKKTPHWPERGWWVWEEVGAQPRQMSSCALRSLFCTPLVSTRCPLLQDSEVVMAPGRWLRNRNKKRKEQKFCPQNWGFLITSSLVIKLETYRIQVYCFLCKSNYKYWSGFLILLLLLLFVYFLGNMSTTIVYIQELYLLFWIQWRRNSFFCTQQKVWGENTFKTTSLIKGFPDSLMTKLSCPKLCQPLGEPGFLFPY